MQLSYKVKRFPIILLGIFCLTFFKANAQEVKSEQNQTTSINIEDQKIIDVLLEIEKAFEVSFVYNPNLFSTSEKISFKYEAITLPELLDELFQKRNLGYKISANLVTIFKSKNPKTGNVDQLSQQAKSEIVCSGYIYDSENGEALIAAYAFESNNAAVSVSNNFGFFSLTLPAGSHEIVFSYLGYEDKIISVNKTERLTIKLNTSANALAEVIVSASEKSREDNIVQSSRMGVNKISSDQLKSIPSLGGEQDVLKALTLLPGIKQGSEGSAGFYVRGGSQDQNLILLDGVPMYNPYHLFGFLSTFNPDAINNIEVTKGAFPARYGGRLSSVLDITTKEGNNQEWKKQISVGLLSARASISGPLVKDKSSIFFSARRTLLDLIIAPIAAERARGFKSKRDYYFGDANLKYNYKLSNKDRIYFSGFYSRDLLKLVERENDETIGVQKFDDQEGWNNAFGSFRWNHLFNDKLFSNTTLYYSSYNYFSNNESEVKSNNTDLIPDSKSSSEYSSIINDWALKQDYQWYLNQSHHIRFGGGIIHHTFKPGVNSSFRKTGTETIASSTPNKITKAAEFSLYAEDEISIGKKLIINLGGHASAFAVEDTNYFSIQPRLSMRYLLSDRISIKAGYAQMTQYLHLLTNGSLINSSDLWVPVTKRITPPRSVQYSLGTAIQFSKMYSVEVEGYYKEMDNLIEYKEGASFLVNSKSWEDKVDVGSGTSYGLEFYVQKKKGRLTGWLGYTLAWSNRTFKNINFGEEFPYKYDRRHDISIVGNYKLNEKWALNATWILYTGNAVTFPTFAHVNPNFQAGQNYSWFTFPNENQVGFDISLENPGFNKNSSTRNNLRLPTYHRLDLTAEWNWITKKDWKAELIFGLTNAYNKFNPVAFQSSVDVIENETGNEFITKYTQSSLFPIMPTVSYHLTF